MKNAIGFDGDSGFRPGPLQARAAVKSTSQPSTAFTNIATDLGRILRPQAAYRWLLPSVAAITPQYIEMTLRAAMAGNHVQQWELFDLMLDTWPELSACQQELIYGVQRKKPIFTAFSEEDEKPTDTAIERMKLVSSVLRTMAPRPEADENALPGTIKDILSGWIMGTVLLENSWQMVKAGSLGQVWGPRSTFWVHPVCYGWDAEGVLGLRTDAIRDVTKATKDGRTMDRSISSTNYMSAIPMPESLTPFPDGKFLIGTHKAKSGSPLSGAMLRPLAWWWCAANFSSDWLLNLAQVFGLPFRWANYDRNAPAATVNAICNMLQNMGSAGWAAFPDGTNLELKDAGKSGDHSPQGELLDRADRYARLLILGQTMSGTHGSMGKGGGQAFGNVEKDVKADRMEAAGDFAVGVINQQLIPAILRLNYGDSEEAPVMSLLEKTEGDLQSAQRDQVIVSMGLPVGVNFLYKKYGIPVPEDDEEIVRPAQPAQTDNEEPDPEDPQGDRNAKPGLKARDARSSSDLSTAFIATASASDSFRPQLEELKRISEIGDDQAFSAALKTFAQNL